MTDTTPAMSPVSYVETVAPDVRRKRARQCIVSADDLSNNVENGKSGVQAEVVGLPAS